MQRHRLKQFFKDCDWRAFEQFVAEYWARGGWIVTLTDARGDGGVDVYLEHPTADYAIGLEVMRHSHGSLSGSDVKEVFFRHKPNTFADVFCVLATTQFSPSAKEAARSVGCDLIGLDAWCQAVDDADDFVLCHQYERGDGWVEDEDDLLARLGASSISISADARNRVIESEFTDAILYQLETMVESPPVVNEPMIDEIESEIIANAPFREYPVRGGYAPAWQGGKHPAAKQREQEQNGDDDAGQSSDD